MARHAVYWTPEPDEALWSAGCAWLGRDPANDTGGIPPADRRAPWRYGFHATLKAPMALREGAAPADFVAAVQALAVRTPAFAMPRLELAWLRGFLALVPAQPLGDTHPLRLLADRCVGELDRWREPLTPEQRARRLADRSLEDDAQRELAARWGSPHVFAYWRFHLSLSDPVPAQEAARRARIEQAAVAHFAAALAAQPLQARSLCVFVEPRPDAPLRLAHRLPLGA